MLDKKHPKNSTGVSILTGASVALLHPNIVKIGEIDKVDKIHQKMIKDTIKSANTQGVVTNNGLVVIHDATHGGMINKNMRLYSDHDLRRRAFKTFFNPFPKPILPISDVAGSHNNDINAIGRIFHAKPFDIPGGNIQIGTVVLKTGSIIIERDGIEKTKDGRNLNVSSSFSGQGTCSICDKHVDSWGCMTHDQGKFYLPLEDENEQHHSSVDPKTNRNAELAFIFVTDINYIHLAYVNNPAHLTAGNAASQTLGIDSVDSKLMDMMLMLRDSTHQELKTTSYFNDDLLEEDINVFDLSITDGGESIICDLSTKTQVSFPDKPIITNDLFQTQDSEENKDEDSTTLETTENLGCGSSSDGVNNNSNEEINKDDVMDIQEFVDKLSENEKFVDSIATKVAKSVTETSNTNTNEVKELIDKVDALTQSNTHLDSKIKDITRAKIIKDKVVNSISAELADARKAKADANKQTYIALQYLTNKDARTEKGLEEIKALTDQEIGDRLDKLVGSDQDKFFKSLNDAIKDIPPVKLQDIVESDTTNTNNDSTGNVSDKKASKRVQSSLRNSGLNFIN